MPGGQPGARTRAPQRAEWCRHLFGGAALGYAFAACGGDGSLSPSPGPPSDEPPPPGASLRFAAPADHVAAGRPLAPIEVAIVDGSGSPLLSAPWPVRLSLTGGTGAAALVGQTTVIPARGVATFADVGIDRPATDVRLEATFTDHPHRVVSEAFDVVETPDLILVRGGGGGSLAALVDGEGARGFVQDRPIASSDSSVEVVLTASAESNEVVVLQPSRAPGIATAEWTAGVDTVDLALLEPIRVPITVWVLEGDFATVRDTVEAAIAGANDIYAEEGAGIEIVDVRVVDATDDPDAPTYRNWPPIGLDPEGIFADIGRDAGRINAYSVDRVSSGGTLVGGVATVGSGLFWIGWRTWGPLLVAHELGHNFSLMHAHEIEGFVDPVGNLMGTSIGPNLTEGQIFHMHFNTASALNLDFGLRTSTQRICANVVIESVDPTCVRVDVRVFPDGPPSASVAPLRLPPGDPGRDPGTTGTLIGRLVP